ncbi:MAG: CBS domain-containing protein [Ectothiorhodospiraceae bacterium]|nr:CBS domain-containing protein [Ectothiorhodospiraceae bacterium]
MDRIAELLSRGIGALARPVAVTCTGHTPLQQVMAHMADAGVDHAVVLRPGGQVQGQITARGLIRHLADPGLRQARAMDAMDPSPELVQAENPVLRLVIRLTGDTPLLVVDRSGALVGRVRPQELLAQLLPSSLSGENAALALPALPALKPALTRELLGTDIATADIQRLLSAINDDIYRRALDASVASLEEDGWGTPPAGFTLLVMGSGGRCENLLAPDQDNALVIDDYPDQAHNAIDSYFAELAVRITDRLDAAGIPRCPGHVMVSNPLWRKTLSQWQRQLRSWIRRRSPQALLNACILLDVRGVAGDRELGETLRQDMIRAVSSAPGFLRALMLNESIKEVGLGWFDRLRTEGGESPHAGELNLKRDGFMPVVEGVRLFALSCGISAHSTLERLAGLHQQGVLDNDARDELSHAFAYMCRLLLKQQARNLNAGQPAGQHVPPESLTRREQETLVRSMKASRGLLEQVHQRLVGTAIN